MLGGRLGASMLDDLLALGRSSCIGTTFLDLDDTMDKLNIVQFLVHHQYIYNPSTGGKNDKGSLKIFKLIKITLKIYIYFFFFQKQWGLAPQSPRDSTAMWRFGSSPFLFQMESI